MCAASDRDTAMRILTALDRFARTGEGDIKKLEGNTGELRLRVGDYRVRFIGKCRTGKCRTGNAGQGNAGQTNMTLTPSVLPMTLQANEDNLLS